MHTRILMASSALFMAVLGLAASFLSHELLAYLGGTVESQAVLIVQILGALYLGFAILNWHARGVLIGGIYSRPLAIGNFLHFAVAAVTLIKASSGLLSPAVWVAAAIYSILAVWFAMVVFLPPRLGETDAR